MKLTRALARLVLVGGSIVIVACSSSEDEDCAPGGTTGTTSAAVSCEEYCTNMTNCCTGANTQYASKDVCLSMCAKMPPGASSDKSANTAGCRQYHASAAVSTPDTHCKHAGPSGGKTCGADPCEAFCQLNVAMCGFGGTAPFASEAACKTACAAWPYSPDSDTTDTNKNTLNCRMYHLEAAYGGGSAYTTHCPHTAANSTACNQ